MIAIATGTAIRLHKAGYSSIIPVIPPDAELSENSSVKPVMRGKVPGKKGRHGWYGFSGWQDSECTYPEVASRWDEWGANVGLIADRFPGVDIDVDDEQLAAVCQKFALKHLGRAPCRLSRGSRKLLVYRTEHPIPKTVLVIEYKGEEHKVEVLGKGNQFLVSGTHPSGSEYRWAKSALWDIDPNDLTEVDEADIYTFLEALSSALATKGIRSRIKGHPGRDNEPVPPQEDLRAPDLEQLEELVGRIKNTSMTFPDRDSYIAFGTAVKAAGGSEALYIFQDWAGRWDEGVNDPAIVASDWERMRPPFRIGWEWLRRKAGDDAQDEFDVDPEAKPPESAVPRNVRESELRKLNEEYAIVQVGSKVRILQERDGQEPVFLRVEDFQLLLKHREVPSAKKSNAMQLLPNAWIGWRDRREYRQVVFRPGQREVADFEYNLWRGWPLKPSTGGSCDRFLDHLLEVVCDGDRELYEWLLDWLAHVFQHPMDKPGIVVALQGGQGAGKSIVGAVLKKLIGPYQVIVDKAQHVTGQFNSHLETCVLLQAEEAFWSGDKKAKSTLKHLVTGEKIRTERKFGDSVEVDNYTRLLITSNEETIWPADIDDRRLVPIRVSDKRKGNQSYFDEIFAELEDGGYEKLLHVLMTQKIDMVRLKVPPRTAALEAQVAESMPPHEAWYLDVLAKGEIEGTIEEDGTVLVPFSRLYEDYRSSVPRRAFTKTDRAFGLWLRDRARPQKEGRVTVSDGFGQVKTTLYRLRPLQELRDEYSAIGRGAPEEWEKPDKWVASPNHNEDSLEVPA